MNSIPKHFYLSSFHANLFLIPKRFLRPCFQQCMKYCCHQLIPDNSQLCWRRFMIYVFIIFIVFMLIASIVRWTCRDNVPFYIEYPISRGIPI